MRPTTAGGHTDGRPFRPGESVELMSQEPHTPDASSLDFDIDALRAKYEEERVKRLRGDGTSQYLTGGKVSAYERDPHTERIEREPLNDRVDVAIIGGGFSGLICGARLRETGIESLRFIDEAGDFGGTWYWNRYPGLIVDVDATVYFPWLEKTRYMPVQKYPTGHEVRGYAQLIARQFDLYRDTCFHTRVTGIRWDELSARWVVSTDRGDRIRARHVINALGPINRIRLPQVPGIGTFKGHTFHANRWDYEYTGGSEREPTLTGLQGKRVAVIGTAATAVQVVPEVAKFAEHLYVVQRTPCCVSPRDQKPTDVDWWNGLKPGWQQERMKNFNILSLGGTQEVDLVDDAWTRQGKALGQVLGGTDSESLTPEELALRAETVDFELMERIRARYDANVADPEVAEKLKPYYAYACKRPVFSDLYLPAFNRPNVTLIDTGGKGIEAVAEDGFIVGGKAYEVDTIIFASGMEFGTSYTDAARFDIVGTGGVTLSRKWANGMRTLHGIFADGFPNCYFIGMTQGTASPNFVYVFEKLATQVAAAIKFAGDSGYQVMEATPEAVNGWVETVKGTHVATHAFLSKCTPGQYNNEGDLDDPHAAPNRLYAGGAEAYFAILREWRESGKFEGLSFSRHTSQGSDGAA